MVSLNGLIIEPLKIINHPKGDILHALKREDHTYLGFGEVYFSLVNFGEIKGWKKHTNMNMNFVVPEGEIKVVAYDDRDESPTKGQFQVVNLSRDKYFRVFIPAGLWVAFQGLSRNTNLLMNLADIQHDPNESTSVPLDSIKFNWEMK
ncbi:dTDP-4-dehydrorhamnose 3,5-epimerase family protein [Vibrio fluvialis]|uniref:dTDP-4-dehydrorhamnose 3,5-epimerase family protein n=1 Tax=Vibrio fluvialis TaxID=676 RepID=UPI001559C464|nr:dTDP-4-dehydrorhamnose 3,5-epimerase family protein [Vibrio fluvialis]EKO3369866.1 dTDP-4-dehydrorhamnose 3,5-epimerase family protein [Vibrio fluvialis]EKO3387396.1 dTDP-4-dehydrorhamnose 3,5-epimerase family protein [Vibrio fluvialis]EKO3418154.1 dTDP-4-dehydrorhamnose 3,5-epimerase family protein [Vibrio fluvialis]EKO3492082.1 dTDP-4-dehydrorhamnose 3,5-epimerase family protein [Vibrio fluvialis]EKO3550821.1 dTDP-4-dehydrorhamnose 3,5-epimerase family protein [Vibrio fluvialis]